MTEKGLTVVDNPSQVFLGEDTGSVIEVRKHRRAGRTYPEQVPELAKCMGPKQFGFAEFPCHGGLVHVRIKVVFPEPCHLLQKLPLGESSSAMALI